MCVMRGEIGDYEMRGVKWECLVRESGYFVMREER